jgi:hypothetical protein
MLSFLLRRNTVEKIVPVLKAQQESSVSRANRLLSTAASHAVHAVKKTAISSAVKLHQVLKDNPIKTVATAMFVNLFRASASHVDEIDPYHLGCEISNPVMIMNRNMNYSLQQGAFVFCKKFFEIVDPYTNKKFFPQELADGFHNQNCTPFSSDLSLSYNPLCSTAGTVHQSWPYYATLVIAENVTCLIDGIKFTAMPAVVYCFNELTDLAARNASAIQQKLNEKYQNDMQSEHTRNMILLGTAALTATALVACGVWHYRRSQYNQVATVEDDTELANRPSAAP